MMRTVDHSVHLIRSLFITTTLALVLAGCGGGGGGGTSSTGATLQSIAVTQSNPTIPNGLTNQFIATGTYSDGTSQNITASVTWSSGATSVATVAASGLATGVGIGNASITAASGAVSGGTTLEVNVTFPAVSIAKWLGNAVSALSFIWDDNNEQHYNIIGPIFDKYGYHASFGIITAPLSKFPDYVPGYKSLLSKGHELCSHSNTHARLIGITEAAMRDELSISKDKIIEIFGVIPKTFIHPGNGRDVNMDFFGDYYLYSRINNINQDPENFIANMSTEDDLIRLNYIYSLNVEKENWVTLAGHGVDGGSYEPILSKDLDDFLYSIKDQSVWVDIYSNVALYNEILLAISSVSIFDQQIVIDDSKINYGRYAAFGITSIPITVIINSSGLKNFIGENILAVKREGQAYLVTINLANSNIINWEVGVE